MMNKSVMKYKDYIAAISYDADDRIFVGEVIGTADSLNFHGSTPDELETSFKNCIENYLEFCAKVGKKPQKTYTGNFNVRISPELHASASEYAARNNLSLNQVVLRALQSFMEAKTHRSVS